MKLIESVVYVQGEEGEDEVRLDEEMERVVWGEGAPAQPPPPPTGEPRRDVAAPLPFAQRHRTGTFMLAFRYLLLLVLTV